MTKDREKKEFLSKEKKLENLHYNIIISFAVLWVLHYTFLDIKTIGGDSRHSIYVFYLPVLFGLILLGFYQKSFLVNIITDKETLWVKLVSLGFVLLQGMLISFLTFGFFCQVIWNQLNIKESASNYSEYFECNIEKFHVESRSEYNDKVWFYFNGETESVEVSNEFIKEYRDKDPDDYRIVLWASKGLWENYIINSWEVKTYESIIE